jgi:putative thiamine transport system ATP-binding protein
MANGLGLKNIRIHLGDTMLLSLDAHINRGEALTIMGPSGSGKSTLLSFITGSLDPAFSAVGHITLDGDQIDTKPAHLRQIGILFQDDLLFPHMSVGTNLSFGLSRSIPRSDRKDRINAALESVGLGGFFDRDPATLSGGQRARVALMRTLLSEPRALLLDEPFSRLDQDLRQQVRELVFGHAKARSLPVLLVTHDAEDAAAAGGPIVTL